MNLLTLSLVIIVMPAGSEFKRMEGEGDRDGGKGKGERRIQNGGRKG